MEQNNFMRQVNASLRRNRRILETHIKTGEEMGRVTGQRLLGEGYEFKYHTHQIANKKGQVYTFCYDLGFLPLDNDWLLVVRRQNKQDAEEKIA